jgi:hypothetical protein
LAVPRLAKIDVSTYPKLDEGDECFHIGEYTAGGGYGASDTNQQIFNLKWKPTSGDGKLYWKGRAISYWIQKLAEYMNLEKVEQNVTLVPAPCSKALGHPEYDDRMLRILIGIKAMRPGIDVREAIIPAESRDSQHEAGRLSVAELQSAMRLSTDNLTQPLKRVVIAVDDVFTQGGTFKAMQAHLLRAPGVKVVRGLFLARTIWPPVEGEIDWEAFMADMND